MFVMQVHVCVMAKLTNILHDRQNFKCLPNTTGSFGWGFRFFSSNVKIRGLIDGNVILVLIFVIIAD